MFTRIRAIRPGDAAGFMMVGVVVTLVLSGMGVAEHAPTSGSLGLG